MKRYHLRILAALTALTFVLAVISVVMDSESPDPRFGERMMFPDLSAALNDINGITVTSFGKEIVLARTDSAEWVVENRGNHPANAGSVFDVLKGVAELKLTEAKTRLPERHRNLGLGPSAIGLNLRLGDEILADVLIGSRKRLPSGGMPGSLYVRLAAGDQTWLAETNLEAPSQIRDWLDTTFPLIINERVHRVVATSSGGEVVTLIREIPGSDPFVLQDLAAGYRMKYASIGNQLGAVFVGLRFDDVKERSLLEAAAARHIVFETFDGMAIDVAVIQDGAKTWITLDFKDAPLISDASADEPSIYLMRSDLVAADIKRYQDLTGHWAYQIPSYKGNAFMLGLEDLVAPIVDEDVE